MWATVCIMVTQSTTLALIIEDYTLPIHIPDTDNQFTVLQKVSLILLQYTDTLLLIWIKPNRIIVS